MTKVWTIAWHEFITNLRRPGFIIFTLLPPTLGLVGLVVAVFFSGQATNFFRSQFTTEQKPIGIIDQAQLFTSVPPQFAKRFVIITDEEAASRALSADQIGAYTLIARDYLATGKLTTYYKGGAGFSGVSQLSRTELSRLLETGLLASKVDATTLARAIDPTKGESVITLDAKGSPTTSNPLSFVSGFIAPYVLSVFLIVSIFISSGYLLRSVSEEKETRVIEIILSSVSTTELLAGKVIGLGALGLTQVMVWLISSFALTGGLAALVVGAVVALSPTSFLLAVVYFILGYLIFAVIMATAGSLGTTQRESQQLASIFTIMASLPYMLGGFLFANPNAGLARVLSFFPFTAPTMMMLRLPLGEVPIEDIIGSILVLIISIPIVLWAGAKIFRMGLLLYGKRPALRQIVRALREA